VGAGSSVVSGSVGSGVGVAFGVAVGVGVWVGVGDGVAVGSGVGVSSCERVSGKTLISRIEITKISTSLFFIHNPFYQALLRH
jgi:hypothetical protein